MMPMGISLNVDLMDSTFPLDLTIGIPTAFVTDHNYLNSYEFKIPILKRKMHFGYCSLC